jgi:hypothetical protein
MRPKITQRRDFTVYEIDYAWNTTNIVTGADPRLYREDKCGNVIYYFSYGKDSEMGWCVDHLLPLSHGGTYHPDNLYALHSLQNKSKSNTYPYQFDLVERLGISVQEFNLRKYENAHHIE